MSGSTPGVRTRKNVLKLTGQNDDLFWYGRAVDALTKLPLNDPTSWWYQAAVHGVPDDPTQFGLPSAPLPSPQDRTTFWNQCQHQTFYFLPWHRGYLACFEEIIAATVVSLGGPPGWALPYWNYSDATNPNASMLPAAFLNRDDGRGGVNPLWVDGRNVVDGAVQLDQDAVNLDCLRDNVFEGSSQGGDPGFGGPSTGLHHQAVIDGVFGMLENAPHNVVHGEIGGWMSDPDTAAADPIFWIHHANIDRLWEVWRNRDPSFVNPNDPNWLTGQTFTLHGAQGRVVNFQPTGMVNTTNVLHGYNYEDISDPFAGARVAAAPSVPAMTAARPRPAMVGASETAIPVSAQGNSARIVINQAAHHAAIAALAPGRPPRALLNIENVTGTGQTGTYKVYVNTPAGTAAGQPPLLAGMLGTFGIAKATRDTSHAGGSGGTVVLDVTGLLDQLRRERSWDGQHLDVSIEPTEAGRLARATPGSSLQIGRLSIYYE
jgi:tyrosinase